MPLMRTTGRLLSKFLLFRCPLPFRGECAHGQCVPGRAFGWGTVLNFDPITGDVNSHAKGTPLRSRPLRKARANALLSNGHGRTSGWVSDRPLSPSMSSAL
jgi:hypothetical protein